MDIENHRKLRKLYAVVLYFAFLRAETVIV